MKISKYFKGILNVPVPDGEIDNYFGRALGKSTSQALGYISEAMAYPECPVVVTDHHGTYKASHFLMSDVIDICNKLGLDWMEFNRSNNTIIYKPYMKLKCKTVTYWEEDKDE